MDFKRDNENFIKMYINEPDLAGRVKEGVRESDLFVI